MCEAICDDSLEEEMEDIKQTFRKRGHSFMLSLAWQHTTKLLEQLEQMHGQAQQSVDSTQPVCIL
jgi:flagellar biosynthesis chaperone FliJ